MAIRRVEAIPGGRGGSRPPKNHELLIKRDELGDFYIRGEVELAPALIGLIELIKSKYAEEGEPTIAAVLDYVKRRGSSPLASIGDRQYVEILKQVADGGRGNSIYLDVTTES
jgi:hypothetical protein